MVCKFHKTLFSNVFFPPTHVLQFQTRPHPRSNFGMNAGWCVVAAALSQKRVR